MSEWVSQLVTDKGKQWSDSGPIKIAPDKKTCLRPPISRHFVKKWSFALDETASKYDIDSNLGTPPNKYI